MQSRPIKATSGADIAARFAQRSIGLHRQLSKCLPSEARQENELNYLPVLTSLRRIQKQSIVCACRSGIQTMDTTRLRLIPLKRVPRGMMDAAVMCWMQTGNVQTGSMASLALTELRNAGKESEQRMFILDGAFWPSAIYAPLAKTQGRKRSSK